MAGRYLKLARTTGLLVGLGLNAARTAVGATVEDLTRHQAQPFSAFHWGLLARGQIEQALSARWWLWFSAEAGYAVSGVRAREDSGVVVDTNALSASLALGVSIKF